MISQVLNFCFNSIKKKCWEDKSFWFVFCHFIIFCGVSALQFMGDRYAQYAAMFWWSIDSCDFHIIQDPIEVLHSQMDVSSVLSESTEIPSRIYSSVGVHKCIYCNTSDLFLHNKAKCDSTLYTTSLCALFFASPMCVVKKCILNNIITDTCYST